jgi:hypothetical protein
MLAVLSLVVAVGASGLPPGWLIQVLTGCASITVVPTMANTSAVALARHPFNAGTAAALFGSGSSQARA